MFIFIGVPFCQNVLDYRGLSCDHCALQIGEGAAAKVQLRPDQILGCLTLKGCMLLLVLNIWLIMRMKIKHQCYANGAPSAADLST